MILKCGLLLALCTFGAVSSMKVQVSWGFSGTGRTCSEKCYNAVRDWLKTQSCKIPGMDQWNQGNSNQWNTPGPQPYFHVTMNDGSIESLPISGVCMAYQICDSCGKYGSCMVEENRPKCRCQSGYSGDHCDGGKMSEVVIAVTVLAGILAVFILIAIIINVCCRTHKPHVAHHHQAAKDHGTVFHSHGHPPVMHAPSICHVQPAPPAPCTCTPTSTLTITELPDNYPTDSCRKVVPAATCGGLFPDRPTAIANIYGNQIRPITLEAGTTITIS